MTDPEFEFREGPAVDRTGFGDRSAGRAVSVRAGRFHTIYDPSAGEMQQWYINDHTIVRDESGRWHLFGITHTEPADPFGEIEFAHASADDLHGPWTETPFGAGRGPRSRRDASVGALRDPRRRALPHVLCGRRR